MKRILFFFILSLSFFLLSVPAFAQASASAGFHYTANQDSQSGQFGADFAAGYTFKGLYLGGEASGNDRNPLRTRYFGSYTYKLGEFEVGGGGGYWRFGRRDGGFGQASLSFNRFHGFGRIGNERFLEGEAAYDLIGFGDRAKVQICAKGTRHENRNSNLIRIYQGGLRLIFK